MNIALGQAAKCKLLLLLVLLLLLLMMMKLEDPCVAASFVTSQTLMAGAEMIAFFFLRSLSIHLITAVS